MIQFTSTQDGSNADINLIIQRGTVWLLSIYQIVGGVTSQIGRKTHTHRFDMPQRQTRPSLRVFLCLKIVKRQQNE